MDIVQLQKQIKNKELGNLYIFVGDNIGLQNIYANKFPNTFRQSSFDDIKTVITTKNIFDPSTKTFIIRDDKECFKNKANIEILKDFKYNKVIFMFTEYDKRSAWYKEFSDYVVEFNQMTEKQLSKIIRDELKVTDEKFIDAIISRCNKDYSQVMNTCDQLKHIKGRYTIKVLDSICPPPIEASVFTLSSLLMKRDIRCYKELELLLSLGEPVLRIQSALLTTFETTRKCLKYNKDYCENEFGIKNWIWKTTKDNCKLSGSEMEECVRLLNECAQLIVSGALVDNLAIKTTLLKIIKNF